jgi:hypothetical protein
MREMIARQKTERTRKREEKKEKKKNSIGQCSLENNALTMRERERGKRKENTAHHLKTFFKFYSFED